MKDIIDLLFTYIMPVLIVYLAIYTVLNWVGWKQFQAGNVKRALWMFDQAVRFYIRPTRALVGRSAVRLSYLSDFNGAIEDSSRAIQYRKKAVGAYNNRGYAFYCIGEIDKCLKDFDTALALKPEYTAVLINRARIVYERFSDYEWSIADCNSAIIEAPKNFTVYYLLIEIYLEMKHFDSALGVCDQATENFLDPAYIHMFRAYVLERQFGIKQAFEDIKAAANLKPDDPIVVTIRGDLFVHAHDYKKAIEAYDKAIQLSPQNVILYAVRGNIYSRLGEYDKAMDDFGHAIQINPYSEFAYNNRADSYARTGNYLASLEDANRCIQLAPFFKYGYDTRGQTHFLMENYTEALADFEKAAELKKGDDYALIGQAVTHYAMGDTEIAKELWQQVIDKDSKYNDVQAFADDFVPAEAFMNAVREVATLGQSHTVS